MSGNQWFTPEMAAQLKETNDAFERTLQRVDLKSMRPENSAEVVCERFHELFVAFEKSLNPDEDIAIALTSFGVVRQIEVSSIASLGPALIVIKGFEGGSEVILVQHLSQLSFLLVPIKRKNPEQPRRKIGFGESV